MVAMLSQPGSGPPIGTGPPTPTSPEPDYSNEPGPPSFAAEFDGKRWLLEIGQQPIRARMCGFGDKDRRPISPPPCVRLVILDAATGEEIDLSKLLLNTMVLTVDLYDKDGSREANLVKHANNSPSISSVSTAAYPRTVTDAYGVVQNSSHGYSMPNMPAYTSSNYASPVSATPSTMSPFSNFPQAPEDIRRRETNGNSHSYGPSLGTSPYAHGYRHGSASSPNGYPPPPVSAMPPQSPYAREQYEYGRPDPAHSNHTTQQNTQGMYTRNLIGNLSASAFRLKDIDGKEGIWFVLQDLSIRTEGWFRLKFSFVNLGKADSHKSENGTDHADAQPGQPDLVNINETAPVLATCFSAPFHVWSAKKFPGVIESTELSKKFAQQGIKIPIRKEGKEGKSKRKRGKGEEDDDGESEEEEA